MSWLHVRCRHPTDVFFAEDMVRMWTRCSCSSQVRTPGVAGLGTGNDGFTKKRCLQPGHR